eukprot:TRINITY_DN4066_c0_g1_i1.p1 TRINITY_DN4066_c0_g1~~TRINITY_DN4066_c0_g1_i1.p1  ORF type:complete len:1449 (-),score=281.84 TRINITY_DN4066_c0_g1_i1:32-4378(-)
MLVVWGLLLFLCFAHGQSCTFTETGSRDMRSVTGVPCNCTGTFTAPGCSTEMNTRLDFLAFANTAKYSTTPRSSGPQSKIYLDARNPADPKVYFFSLKSYSAHKIFAAQMGWGDLHNYPSNKASYVYNADKWFYACDFLTYTDTDGSVIFALQFNAEDKINEYAILYFVQAVMKHLHFIGTERVAFVRTAPVGATNRQMTTMVKNQIADLGVEILDKPAGMWCTLPCVHSIPHSPPPSGIPPFDQFYWPMNLGEAYGYVRPFPTDPLLGVVPTDIAFLSDSPLFLGVLAGTLTLGHQSPNSHVNLKSKERQTPNMVLSNLTNPVANELVNCILKQFTDRPVRMQVSGSGFAFQHSSAVEVATKVKEAAEKKSWISMNHVYSLNLTSFDELCVDIGLYDCISHYRPRIGTKAASLGFLAHPSALGRAHQPGTYSASAGYDVSPYGFGLPFGYFKLFLDHPPNRHIKEVIYDLSELEASGLMDPDERIIWSNRITKLFYDAEVPQWMIDTIRARAREIFNPLGIKKLKFRSSSNSEDLQGFNGAGLYDSYQWEIEKESEKDCFKNHTDGDMQPKTLDCALKGTYASLYTLRALEERAFARIRHDSCLMGAAVVEKYSQLGEITQNSVVVTKINDPKLAAQHVGYTYSLQQGTNTATNPIVGTLAENQYLFVSPDGTLNWQIDNYAITKPGGKEETKSVLPVPLRDRMHDITLKTEFLNCKYIFRVPEDECKELAHWTAKVALDMEFKVFDNERVFIKQFRTFQGSSTANFYINYTALAKDSTACYWEDQTEFDVPAESSLINVALLKPATQHSTVGSGNASLAFNNELFGGLFTETSVGTGVWLSVDLKGFYDLAYIRIFNGPVISEFKKFDVQVTFSDGSTVTTTHTLTAAKMYLLGPFSFKPKLAMSVKIIQKEFLPLKLTEVQVWAIPPQVGNASRFDKPPRAKDIYCVWGEWTSWSTCTAKCGGGIQTRTRADTTGTCTTTDISMSNDTQTCNTVACCKVSAWSSWSSCNCEGKQSQTRSVTNSPCYNDATAVPLSQTQSCTVPTTCTPASVLQFNLIWPNNTGKTLVKADLEAAIKDQVVAQYGVDQKAVQIQVNPYPIGGDDTRRVTILTTTFYWNKPTTVTPALLTDPIFVPAVEAATKGKLLGEPVDCLWTEWTTWSDCSAACGTGNTTRTRVQNPAAANFGKACTGVGFEQTTCNTNHCPVDCVWGEWSDWVCSTTCGEGIKKQTRKPSVVADFGGVECAGPISQVSSCKNEECPSGCSWSNWGPYSSCTRCGEERTRIRSLTGDAECKGKQTGTAQCPACSPGEEHETAHVSFKLKSDNALTLEQIRHIVNSGLPENYVDGFDLSGPDGDGFYNVELLEPSENASPKPTAVANQLAVYLRESALDVKSDTVSSEDLSSGGSNVGLIVGLSIGIPCALLLVIGVAYVFMKSPADEGMYQSL